MAIIVIEFPVFADTIIHVETSKDFEKTIQKYPCIRRGEECLCDANALTISAGNVIFIFLRPNADVGAIAHESWHAVRYMLGTLGVDLDNETVAYHLGYLVNKIFNFIRRNR